MNDDWSLKNKELRIFDAFGRILPGDITKINGYIEGRYNSNYRALIGYRKKEIETLRKKLIKDFDEYGFEHHASIMRVIKEIINKRFGVEE